VLLCTRRRWVRVLAVAYPVLTTVVVVATANHYLLDAVAGVAVLAAGAAVAVRLPARWGGPPAVVRPSGSAQAQHSVPGAWEEQDGRAAA
jgi:hypothetical protein